MERCALCHEEIVRSYLGHGMARSVGPVSAVVGGTVTNPVSGNRYQITTDQEGARLTATFPDGGTRRQRLVGRIGAGIFDTSWAGAEVDGLNGTVTGRLFFAPVETLTGRGLTLSPFELHAKSPGLDLALTEGCLTCHTLDDPGGLPGADTAVGATKGGQPFPPNALGADAFEHLSTLSCGACHGEVQRHADILSGRIPAPEGEIGLTRLSQLPPGVQRDICARCHLQGDARIDLVKGKPRRGAPLAGQIAVLVPQQALPDFRFVGQLERLALSACFKGSPAMTCTTCHQPHVGVAAQGTASFNAACLRCHPSEAASHTQLSVKEITGAPPRREAGCVDCHVRRSEPFDLPHVRTADHFIRRRLPLPQDDIPHRQFADRGGALALFDDGRLAPILKTPEGQRWQAGILAMGYATLGRLEEAARQFEQFPQPGSAATREPAVPDGLVPLQSEPSFHTVRALVLVASGKLDAAAAALSDALTLDPLAAEARMARARLRLDARDIPGAFLDTQALIDAYPKAQQPWDLRVEIAERVARPDLALSALDASTRLWPSNATAWLKLGLLLRQRGDSPERARQALERARSLSPSLSLPGQQPSVPD